MVVYQPLVSYKLDSRQPTFNCPLYFHLILHINKFKVKHIFESSHKNQELKDYIGSTLKNSELTALDCNRTLVLAHGYACVFVTSRSEFIKNPFLTFEYLPQ